MGYRCTGTGEQSYIVESMPTLSLEVSTYVHYDSFLGARLALLSGPHTGLRWRGRGLPGRYETFHITITLG